MAQELNPTMSQNFIHDFIDEDIAQAAEKNLKWAGVREPS